VTRNVFGIIFFVASGFFVYIVNLLSFIDFPDVGSGKFLIMAFFCIPLVISHSIGLGLYRGNNWKISTGITFFVGALVNLFIVIVILLMASSPELAEITDTSSLSMFSDYSSGVTTMAICFISGITLYIFGKSNKIEAS